MLAKKWHSCFYANVKYLLRHCKVFANKPFSLAIAATCNCSIQMSLICMHGCYCKITAPLKPIFTTFTENGNVTDQLVFGFAMRHAYVFLLAELQCVQ